MNDAAFEEWIDAVKDVDMEEVLQHEGIEIRYQGNTRFIKCPNPSHNDHNPSCVVKPHYCRCFSCGYQAGALKLIQTLHGLDSHGSDFLESANILASIGGLPQWTAKSSRQDADEKHRPITKAQLQILGLHVHSRVFIRENELPWKPKESEGITYESIGLEYIQGRYEKISLYDLYREDEIAFNYMLLGKLHETLIELISNHALERWWDEKGHKEMEEQIELLLPIAQLYMEVAPSYGYNFSWIKDYHATRVNTIQSKYKLEI